MNKGVFYALLLFIAIVVCSLRGQDSDVTLAELSITNRAFLTQQKNERIEESKSDVLKRQESQFEMLSDEAKTIVFLHLASSFFSPNIPTDEAFILAENRESAIHYREGFIQGWSYVIEKSNISVYEKVLNFDDETYKRHQYKILSVLDTMDSVFGGILPHVSPASNPDISGLMHNKDHISWSYHRGFIKGWDMAATLLWVACGDIKVFVEKSKVTEQGLREKSAQLSDKEKDERIGSIPSFEALIFLYEFLDKKGLSDQAVNEAIIQEVKTKKINQRFPN